MGSVGDAPVLKTGGVEAAGRPLAEQELVVVGIVRRRYGARRRPAGEGFLPRCSKKSMVARNNRRVSPSKCAWS
jgi:hypothetical protein